MVHFAPLPHPDERFMKPPPKEATILIVGSGPAGLFASLLFAKNNIRSIIIERHGIRTGQPKAHAINPRSLEILRQAGLDTKRLRGLGSSVADAGVVSFVTVVAKTEIGRITYERQDEAVKALTPEPLFNIPQPVLEKLIQEAALETGLVTIHRRWEWQDVVFDGNGKPTSRIINRSTNEKLDISSEYLIGADGTESVVRQKMNNVTFDGLPDRLAKRRHYVSIQARGSLRQKMHELGDRFAVLYFCMHPKHRNAIIMYDLDSSWVYARVIDPTKETAESFTMERCRELLDGSLGAKVDYEVISANLWYTDPRIASSYADETFRIFLAGDAAHTFPPTGGLGINTGIADVHNLCWKISAVLSNNAMHPFKLLSSYSSERRPVAITNALQSFINQDRQNEELEPTVATALGGISVDDDEAIEQQFQIPAIQNLIQESIDQNRPHFDSLGLQLGYIYGEGDGTLPMNDCSIFSPSARPGARLPHCWVADGQSILDFLDVSSFSLLHSGGGTFSKERYLVDGKEHVISKVDIEKLGVPDQWKDLVGINHGEGLLIRPDQHVLGKALSDEDAEKLFADYM
jgi:2,4-dichlorophenol 6-monooxygenase